jgi:hypothetical protein
VAIGDQNLKFQNLTVLDVLTDLYNLDVVDYDEVKNALVVNLIATLAKPKCTHILVVQAAKIQGPARISGVILQTQLERQLSSKASGW